MLLFHA